MKRMRKWLGMILCMMLCLTVGCGQTKQQATTQETLAKDQIFLYYVNRDKTDVVKEKYTLEERDDLAAQVKELVGRLSGAAATTEYQASVPEGISYTSCNTEHHHGRIELMFNVAYSSVDAES